MAFNRTQRLALAIIPPVAALITRLLGATLRYTEVTAPGTIPGDRMPAPSVYAFWHRSLLLAAHRFRDHNVAILISRSFDGELIARTVERLGYVAVRGSSSRGGSSGLMGMEHAYRNGHICAITADGPRGPTLIAKPGAAQLAKLTHASIGAFYVFPLRAWRLNTWDGFFIPKPFSHVLVTWPPIVAAEDVTEAKVQEALDRAVEMSNGKETN